MIVKLRRKNSRYPDLAPRQNYVVIGVEADDLRILNDQGRPYLYPVRLFEIVDAREPADWIAELGEDVVQMRQVRMVERCEKALSEING